MKRHIAHTILTLFSGLSICSIATANQPSHSSKPASEYVLYIDYDGELYSDPNHYWTSETLNLPSFNMTNTEIEESWKYVAEAYKAFNVNVTTDRAVYDGATPSKRLMCLVTSDDQISPGNGGVALVNSFGSDTVCWSFDADPIVIVHEFGHTFGLYHDGLGTEEYHPGQDDGWAPHMGAAPNSSHLQWSKGEYFGATETQDDLAKIANDLPYITDEAVDTLQDAANATAVNLSGTPASGLTVEFSGLIGAEQNNVTDVDVYRFDLAGGVYDLDLVISPAHTSLLDLEVRVYDNSWQEIAREDFDKPAVISISESVTTNQIYVLVKGGSKGAPLTEPAGWTSYGSIGEYNISFNATRTATSPISNVGFAPITEDSSQSYSMANGIGSTVTTVSATDYDSNDNLTYTIVGGNEAGIFNVDAATGEVTVAGSFNFYIKSYYNLEIEVTDSNGLSNIANIGINLNPITVHDESTDGELSNTYNSPTGINVSKGLNTIKGTCGDNGQSGGDYGDGEYFSFNIPEGLEISEISIDFITADANPLVISHNYGDVYSKKGDSGSDGVIYATNAPDTITNNFSNLQSGFHAFFIESLYASGGDLVDYQLTIYVTDVNDLEWDNQDIGNTASTGEASINGFGETTIIASGADIWNSADEFHYAYQTLSGDGVITARVKSLSASHIWAKAGVMIRDGLSNNTKNVGIFVTGNNGISSQSRSTSGANTTHQKGDNSASAPYWVRVARKGDVFTSSQSTDGYIWDLVKTWTVSMSDTVQIGLASTSHEDGVSSTAVFDYVSVIPSDLGIEYDITTYDNESNPENQNLIRILNTKVGYIKNGTWIAFDNFNFSSDANTINLSASSGNSGGVAEVRLGSPTGELIAEINVSSTGGWNTFETFQANLNNTVEGIHDLYLVFTGGSQFLMDVKSFTIDTSEDLGVTINAVDYDNESAPSNENSIRNMETKIGFIGNGSWVAYHDFNFDSGVSGIDISAASANNGGTVEVRLNSSTGTLLTSVPISNTGGWNTFNNFSASINTAVTGTQDLYLVFTGSGSGLFDIESFKFN